MRKKISEEMREKIKNLYYTGFKPLQIAELTGVSYFSVYIMTRAKERGFESLTEYREHLANKKGYKNYAEHQRELAKKRKERLTNRELSDLIKMD